MNLLEAPTGKCVKCSKRDATIWWTFDGGLMGAIHGQAEARCELCCVTEQLEHARAQLANVEELKKRILTLKIRQHDLQNAEYPPGCCTSTMDGEGNIH